MQYSPWNMFVVCWLYCFMVVLQLIFDSLREYYWPSSRTNIESNQAACWLKGEIREYMHLSASSVRMMALRYIQSPWICLKAIGQSHLSISGCPNVVIWYRQQINLMLNILSLFGLIRRLTLVYEDSFKRSLQHTVDLLPVKHCYGAWGN